MRKQLPRGAEREPSLDISKRGRKDSDNISHQGRLAKGVPNTFSLVPPSTSKGCLVTVQQSQSTYIKLAQIRRRHLEILKLIGYECISAFLVFSPKFKLFII